MTTNATPPTLEFPAFEDDFDAGDLSRASQKRPAWRRKAPLLVTAALVVALAGMAGGYQVWDSRVEQNLSVATDTLAIAVDDLEQAVATSQKVLADHQGRLDGHETVVALADALAEADALSTHLSSESRQARTNEAMSLTNKVQTVTASLTIASAAVVEAVEALDLQEAVAAHETAADRLTRATAAAQETLTASEEQVADNAVREQLHAQIQTATAVEPVVVDESAAVVDQTATLEAATANLTTIADALDAAHQDVKDARAAWQEEQERIAAEQAEQARLAAEAAAAAAATQPRTSAGTTPTTRSGTTGASTSPQSSTPRSSTSGQRPASPTPRTPAPAAPAPAPAAPAPAPAPGGGAPSHQDVVGGSIGDHVGDGWVITDGGGQRQCGDTSGNPSVDC